MLDLMTSWSFKKPNSRHRSCKNGRAEGVQDDLGSKVGRRWTGKIVRIGMPSSRGCLGFRTL